MTWTYRIIRDAEGGHRIAEVYGDPNAHPAWTADPVYPWGDTLGELKRDMTRMMKAFKLPVLDEVELARAAKEGKPQ